MKLKFDSIIPGRRRYEPVWAVGLDLWSEAALPAVALRVINNPEPDALLHLLQDACDGAVAVAAPEGQSATYAEDRAALARPLRPGGSVKVIPVT